MSISKENMWFCKGFFFAKNDNNMCCVIVIYFRYGDILDPTISNSSVRMTTPWPKQAHRKSKSLTKYRWRMAMYWASISLTKACYHLTGRSALWSAVTMSSLRILTRSKSVLRLTSRYKTTVSFARERKKIHEIVRTKTDMARFHWLLFKDKYWRTNQICATS